MRRLLTLLLLTLPVAVWAQGGTFLDEIWIDTRASFHQDWTGGAYNSHFQGDYLNLHLKGQLAPGLTYRIRQRLNVQITSQNPFKATDFLWLKWQATPKWAVTLGKQPIMIGGYEIDSAPIDVYYYGAFSNRLEQYYAFGAAVTFTPFEQQNISVQFCPSPVSPATQNAYSYNLYWNGHFTPWWKTTWSYNYVEDARKMKMNWIVLGNKFLLGPLAVDIDLINRASFDQPHFFFTDWTVIGKAILSLGKWNLCTKVGYEKNDAANVDAMGNSYDLVLPAGNDYFYYGAGVEFFPLGNENLRLHAAWFRDNHDNIHNVALGITWRFWLYRRQNG